jgi:hypothetical protein
MARPARASAAPKAEERKGQIFSIPSGGGIIATIKSEAIIYDPETNTNRQIRYCPNESSIFADEQSSLAVRRHVIFEGGLLYAPANQPNLLSFLELHPANRANGGGLFEEVNTENNAEVDINVEFLLHDAIGLIRSKSVDELIPVAIWLGIDTGQKNAEIKRELLLEAKANPKSEDKYAESDRKAWAALDARRAKLGLPPMKRKMGGSTAKYQMGGKVDPYTTKPAATSSMYKRSGVTLKKNADGTYTKAKTGGSVKRKK